MTAEVAVNAKSAPCCVLDFPTYSGGTKPGALHSSAFYIFRVQIGHTPDFDGRFLLERGGEQGLG